MIKKISIERLNGESVTIITQKFIEDEGELLPVGVPHACAYVNSAQGRQDIAKVLDDKYLTAVMSVWGDEPTVGEENPSEQG